MRACLSRERGGDFSFSLNQSDRCIFPNLQAPACAGRAMQPNPEFVALPIVSRAARRTAYFGHRPVRRLRYSINIATFAGLQRPRGEPN
jgi:hypothetical protein